MNNCDMNMCGITDMFVVVIVHLESGEQSIEFYFRWQQTNGWHDLESDAWNNKI